MNLTLWRPQSSWLSFERDVDRLFDSLWRSPLFEAPVNLVPPMEVTENENEYRVKMEIPGIEEKDLSITLSDGVLSVKGEKKSEDQKKDEMCYCSEVTYGSFERAISLPRDIDAEKVAAQYKNGVLVITLPKREDAKPKKIEIKVAK